MQPATETTPGAASQPPSTTRKSKWLGRIVRVFLLLLALLLTAVATLPYTLPWLLQKQGIELHWQQPQWQLSGFTAAQLQLKLPGVDAQQQFIRIDNLRIDWAWQAFPIQRLQAQRLQAHWPITADEQPAEQSSQTFPKALLKWLPQHVQLQDIDAQLPGLGHLQGALELQASAQGKLWQPSFIDSTLSLQDLQGPWLAYIPTEYRPTQLSAQITSHPDHQDSPEGQQLLTLDVHSLGPMRLQLNGLLDLQQTPDWHGTLSNAQLFVQLDALTHPAVQAEQLQARLYFSGHANTEDFALRLTEHSSLEAHNLEFAELASAHTLTADLAGLDISGPSTAPEQLKLNSPFKLHLEKLNLEQLHEQDWQLTGALSGQLSELQLSSQLSGEHGLTISSNMLLHDNSLQGTAILQQLSFTDSNPLQKTFRDWPETAAIHSGQLHTQVDFYKTSDGTWTASLNLKGSNLNAALDRSKVNNMNLELSSQLQLTEADSWQVTVSQGEFLLQLDELKDPSFHIAQLQARTLFAGQLDSDNFSLEFNEQTRIDSADFQLPEVLQGQKFSAHLAKLSVKGSTRAPLQALISSPLNIQIKGLHSEQLHNQDWAFNGALDGQLAQLALNGELTGEHGLNLTTLIRMQDGAAQGNVTLKEVFFRASNPLQKTLKDWPELVSFDSGRLRSRMDFSLPSAGPVQLSLEGSASGLNGIINRSELNNMGLDFNAQLSGQSLTLHIPSLTIEQLDPGVPLTAMQLDSLGYRASLDNLLGGIADWQHMQVQLLNGRVWLAAQQLDLSRRQKVVLRLEGLELQELFRVYPAEGLAGNGIIDGQLPLHIERDAVYIEAGQLQARQPGVLQFHSEKIQALGRSNPAMQIVADALDDFHFNLLTSGLSYDQSGKLLLNVRLEGQNPNVEKGRPIHLNISLEEDIPALLASIQLSDQVSEIIQKRVRERLEKR